MIDRVRENCENCNGTGQVVDENQAGEQVATCMTCKGNGWIHAGQKPQKPAKLNEGWLRSPRQTKQ